MTENVAETTENVEREQTAAELRAENKRQLMEAQKAKGVATPTKTTDTTDAAAAKDAAVINGVDRKAEEKAETPAKPARTRKTATKDPKRPSGQRYAGSTAKPGAKAKAEKVTVTKKVADPKPEPETTTEPSARNHNQVLAKRLIDLVAGEFKAESEEDQIKIANWLKVLPTGGAGYQRYWPTGFARPTTADWKIPS
jgi:hypothetical protein